jgi:pyruvate,water dikinase
MVLRHRKHYNKPMDIEWAKDGLNNQLYIVQADQKRFMEKTKASSEIYKLKEKDSLSQRNRIG